MRTRVVIVFCLMLGAAFVVALPVVAQDDATSSGNDSVENATVGQSISGFMQSTEASAEGDVDQGVYRAKFDAANESEQMALVEDQTTDLEERLESVQQRIDDLQEERDEMNPTAYRAQMSAAAAQLRAIEASANQTQADAASSGVNTTRLETLRNNASELSGQEVAAIARSIAGASPHGGNQTGPPENPGAGSGQPNGTPGNSGNGPSDDPDAGTDSGNEADGTGTSNHGDGGQDTGNDDPSVGAVLAGLLTRF